MNTLPSARQAGKREPAQNLLSAALEYAERGWRVFPLHNPNAGGCSCGNRDCTSIGKHPRTATGSHSASTDAVIIREWWERWPEANIAIATGPESGFIALDVDGEKGQASLDALGELPRTLRVFTGRTGASGERTGFHLYFVCPAGVTLSNKPGLLGIGLDIRAAGAYVVAPPSLHTSGLCYEWDDSEHPIAHLPTTIIDKAKRLTAGLSPAFHPRLLNEGERNDVLFRRACAWRRGGAQLDELERRLLAENYRLCRVPLDRTEVLVIAANAAKYPVGGPDPLQEAWTKAEAEEHVYSWDKFLALLRHLHYSRPGLPILLPVERIAKLIRCDRTLIGRHRRKAVALGWIEEVVRYVPKETATQYRVRLLPE